MGGLAGRLAAVGVAHDVGAAGAEAAGEVGGADLDHLAAAGGAERIADGHFHDVGCLEEACDDGGQAEQCESFVHGGCSMILCWMDVRCGG